MKDRLNIVEEMLQKYDKDEVDKFLIEHKDVFNGITLATKWAPILISIIVILSWQIASYYNNLFWKDISLYAIIVMLLGISLPKNVFEGKKFIILIICSLVHIVLSNYLLGNPILGIEIFSILIGMKVLRHKKSKQI